MQPIRKQLAARRVTAGLAVANSREHNNADSCFLTGPKGAPQIGQCRVAVLVKGMPLTADCALPWPIWGTLHPSILNCSTTNVNVLPKMDSIYRWEGELRQGQEHKIFIKTCAHRLTELDREISAAHPYAVAEILHFKIDSGSTDYLNWIAQSTQC